MRLLDLFCCQGGAARGYADAGFDAVHASPPCQIVEQRAGDPQ